MVSALGVPANRRFPVALLFSLLPILVAVISAAIWVPRSGIGAGNRIADRCAAMVQSIVGVKAIVPSNARTAELLGTERTGQRHRDRQRRTDRHDRLSGDGGQFGRGPDCGRQGPPGRYRRLRPGQRLRPAARAVWLQGQADAAGPVGGGQGRRSPAGAQPWRAGGRARHAVGFQARVRRLLGVSAGRGAVHVAAHHGFRRGGPGVARWAS